jgi:hypothetical protein
LLSASRFFSNRVVSDECLLLVVVESRAGDGELGVVALDEVPRLGVEAEFVEACVDRRDASEQPGVQTDGVGVLRVEGSDLFFELVGELGAV